MLRAADSKVAAYLATSSPLIIVLALFAAKIMLGTALPTSVISALGLLSFAVQVLLTVLWAIDARSIESESMRIAWIAVVVLGGTLGQLAYINAKFAHVLHVPLRFGASERIENDQDSW